MVLLRKNSVRFRQELKKPGGPVHALSKPSKDLSKLLYIAAAKAWIIRVLKVAEPSRLPFLTDVATLVPDYITVTSKDLLAVKGPWFTAGHIESAGGESIAKLASGRKLWIISTNFASSQFVLNITDFNSVYRLLMLPESMNRNERKLCRGLRYHLAEPGDVLIQPPLFAHCVLTGRSLTSDGMSRWSLVHGWEGVNISDLKRGSRVFGRFSFGSGQNYVEEWIQRYGLDELIDRIRHRDWKRALKKWRTSLASSSVSGVQSVDSPNCAVSSALQWFSKSVVLDHLEAFKIVGYDLSSSFENRNKRKRKPCRSRKSRLSNIKRAKAASCVVVPELPYLDSEDEEDVPLSVYSSLFPCIIR